MAQGPVKLKPIKSSNIKAIGYDGKKRTLYLQFTYKSKVFSYSPFSREQFQRFSKSESKGKIFHSEIKTDGAIDVSEVELTKCYNCEGTFDETYMINYGMEGNKVCEDCNTKVINEK